MSSGVFMLISLGGDALFGLVGVVVADRMDLERNLACFKISSRGSPAAESSSSMLTVGTMLVGNGVVVLTVVMVDMGFLYVLEEGAGGGGMYIGEIMGDAALEDEPRLLVS